MLLPFCPPWEFHVWGGENYEQVVSALFAVTCGARKKCFSFTRCETLKLQMSLFVRSRSFPDYFFVPDKLAMNYFHMAFFTATIVTVGALVFLALERVILLTVGANLRCCVSTAPHDKVEVVKALIQQAQFEVSLKASGYRRC